MPEKFATMDEPLPVEEALRVNEACDRFEVAWQAAASDAAGPRIEDFLADTAGPERAALLRHLVLLDVDYRRLRALEPAAAEYGSRFPELSSRFLEEALAAGEADVAEVETTIYTPAFRPQLRSLRYVVGQFHARGGIGEVWLARDSEIGRQVALKRLRKKRLDQKERFLAEAQITGQLEHPGIVPVHDLGIDEDGQAFYVMSFIRGRPYREAIEEHHADTTADAETRDVRMARLLEVFVKVCQAVAYAHHRGVIHRDLKPENVMLGPFGEALVLDWGMAKVLNQPEPPPGAEPVQASYSSGSGETRAGTIMGSPSYMAPEMAAGHADQADQRTDVYLLGGTLYHALTGRAPHQGADHSEVVERARTTAPPSPRQVKRDVPRALDAVCGKAMAYRPQDRYAGALELAEDVERYLAGVPVSAYREPPSARAWRWCKRHRRALGRSAAVAVVLALVLAGGAVVMEARQRAEAASHVAELAERERKARTALAEFHQLVEEHHFHLPYATQSKHAIQYYDAGRGREAGAKAIEMADPLGRELEELGLRDEREVLDRQLHRLLLQVALAETRTKPDAAAVPRILDRLERAAALSTLSQSYHRLRARCFRAVGDGTRAEEEDDREKEAAATPLDHFLRAEECHVRALESASSLEGDVMWLPNQELLREAVEEYRLALRDDPGDFWYHQRLGWCYLALNRGEEALEEMGTCLALKPKAAWVRGTHGLMLGLMGRYPDGEADLERALKIDPDFRPALLDHGLLAWLQGKDEQALEDFAGVLKPPEDRRLIAAAYYRGLLHLGRNEYRQALEDFDTVVKENPDFRPVYLTRAQAHFLNKDADQGLADYRTFLDKARAKKFEPTDPALPALRGRLLLRLVPKWGLAGDDYRALLELARAQMKEAQTRGHRTADLFADLGSVADLLGKSDEAIAFYEEALKRQPPPALAVKMHTQRGWIYAQHPDGPDVVRADADFSKAVELDTTHADAHAGLGYVAVKRGLTGPAHREALLAEFHEGDNYVILHNVACIYAELSLVEKGQEKQNQDLAMELLRRGDRLCRKGGEGNKAIEMMKAEPSFKLLRDDRPEDWKKLIGE